MGERDFGKIYKDVINFIRDKSMPKFDDGKPIVFTHFDFDDEDDEQFRVLNSFMDQFSGGANDIAIYPVNHLFHAIIKELAAKDRCDDIPHDNYVKTLLSYDPYEATGKICCKVFCVLSAISVRTAYGTHVWHTTNARSNLHFSAYDHQVP